MMPKEHPATPVRLLVAEDSPTVRSIIHSMVSMDHDILVVGEAGDGKESVSLALRLRPDVVLMDIKMPLMDGIEATRKIMSACPTPIIAFSSLTWGKEAQGSMDMLAAGAVDVMAKPDFSSEPFMAQKALELRQKIRLVSKMSVARRSREAGETPAPPIERSLRIPPTARYEVLGIGASSGGPGALRIFLSRLPSSFHLPILVVQHITAGFLAGFIEWLQNYTALEVRPCAERDKAARGTVLIAPEGRQMTVHRGGVVQAISRIPKGVHLPSVNILFSSIAEVYGDRAIGILMTGMGADGVEGLLQMRRAGGLTIAQDEKTSVVFGMPGEAVRQGAAGVVLSPAEMAASLAKIESLPDLARGGERA